MGGSTAIQQDGFLAIILSIQMKRGLKLDEADSHDLTELDQRAFMYSAPTAHGGNDVKLKELVLLCGDLGHCIRVCSSARPSTQPRHLFDQQTTVLQGHISPERVLEGKDGPPASTRALWEAAVRIHKGQREDWQRMDTRISAKPADNGTEKVKSLNGTRSPAKSIFKEFGTAVDLLGAALKDRDGDKTVREEPEGRMMTDSMCGDLDIIVFVLFGSLPVVVVV
ncbi:hypothetical protein EYF80_013099 [Liparis tanakae]|uniref:Uncharacterized protein n=1 Tax=Liparis tanakae TaxID=230148 RepID=A0A4Z2IFN8_9TELE|nr:hypothetical protein EYF80_013099 [Liparis tanakae]